MLYIYISLKIFHHIIKICIKMSEDAISVSENVQMYLVTVLRLSVAGQPVPLSKLAEVLDVSPVSVNQMCHKLQDDGLAEYVPYKGVTITLDGSRLARHILRRHRLWEVFLVEHLHMGLQQAHDSACRLEHATADEVIERLAQFLSHPSVNPEGDPIPDAAGESQLTPTLSLAEMEIGQRGQYLRCDAGEACREFLAGQGLRPGADFRILATAADSLLLESDGRTVALSMPLASAVQVTVAGTSSGAARAATDQAGTQPPKGRQ